METRESGLSIGSAMVGGSVLFHQTLKTNQVGQNVRHGMEEKKGINKEFLNVLQYYVGHIQRIRI